MKLRQAQYQYIVVTYVASPMKIGGANIDYNLRLTEVGDYEALTFKLKQMLNRSRNAHKTTEPPILVRCCYVPFFFTNLK
jgi:hypothetical protein